MKITGYEVIHIKTRTTILKVFTDAGITGLGEPLDYGHGSVVAAAIAQMFEYPIGKDPRQIEDHWQQLYHPRVSQRIAATRVGLLSTSIVTVEEQLRGRLAVIASSSQDAQRLAAAYTDLQQTFLYFRTWQILPFTHDDSQTFRQLRRQGVRIGTCDLRIAASALNNRLIIVTSNASDFTRVPGLSVEAWSV